MKTIVKIFILVAIATLPSLSRAEEDKDFNKWIELAEKGYITKQEAATAIEKVELERMAADEESLRQHYEIQKQQRELEKEEIYYRAMIPITICIAIALCIAVVSIFYFRNQRRKDEQEKEMLNKLIDKGILTQAHPATLELFNKQKSAITIKNFISDATITGIGFGILTKGGKLADIIILVASILYWVGLFRIIVRSITAITMYAIKRKVNKKVSESSTTTPADRREKIAEVIE